MLGEIITSPYQVSLIGNSGKIEDKTPTEKGFELMNPMWEEVRRLQLPNTGINYWVYLPDDELFTGVELKVPTPNIGSLTRLDVRLDRYLRYVLWGDYSGLQEAWDRLVHEMYEAGEIPTYYSLEVYGHWDEDPAKMQTTILIGLESRHHP